MPNLITFDEAKLDALTQSEKISFRRKLEDRLRESLHKNQVINDQKAMNALIDWGLFLCQRAQISRQCDIARFFDLFSFIGLNFPLREDTRWCREILAATDVPAEERLSRVESEIYNRIANDGR